MPQGSSVKTENFVHDVSRLIDLRVTHERAPLSVLEALTLKRPSDVMVELINSRLIQEIVILQTCNRVEFCALATGSDPPSSAKTLAEYWLRRTNFEPGKFNNYLEMSFGRDVIRHIMRMASGLESMVVGEDQILGQVQEALDVSAGCGAAGPVLKLIFDRAVKIGRIVRAETRINKGSVSIGSVAVNLLEEAIGDLKTKMILIVGAGQIGGFVAKALEARKPSVVFVANRTYDRAVTLAKTLDAQAVRFDRVGDLLATVDAVVVATSAPHYVLTSEQVAKATRERNNRLLIMDISQPRNVNEGVARLPNVELRNIDNLRGLAEVNLQMRLKEAEKAEAIVEDEVNRLLSLLQRERVEPIISAIYNKMDRIRSTEIAEALRMMSSTSGGQAVNDDCRHCRKVVDDLSQVLVRKLLDDPIRNVRTRAAEGDIRWAITLAQLFDLKPSESGEN